MYIEIASMRQFQCVPTTYVTEIKETYFEIHTKQGACPLASLFLTSQTAHQYLNTCHYMANCLYLHDSYITKVDSVKYACKAGSCMVVIWSKDYVCDYSVGLLCFRIIMRKRI